MELDSPMEPLPWTAERFQQWLTQPAEPNVYPYDDNRKGYPSPTLQSLVRRGKIVQFDSQFMDHQPADAGLLSDLALLEGLPLEGVYVSGPCDIPLKPFLCEFPGARENITARRILEALFVREFRSEHIPNLDVENIAYPGYRPGTLNDEIHNSFDGQYLFESQAPDENWREPPPDFSKSQPISELLPGMSGYVLVPQPQRPWILLDERKGLHGQIKSAVVDGKLWYVLLHPLKDDGKSANAFPDKGPFVLLFAVGLSRRGSRLIGIASYQLCHNLCD